MPCAYFARANYPPAEATLQSTHAGIRREAGRTGALRDHDGRSARTVGRDHGPRHRRDVIGGPARSLLPKSALAGQTSNGHSADHEGPDGREGTDSERDGRAEEGK